MGCIDGPGPQRASSRHTGCSTSPNSSHILDQLLYLEVDMLGHGSQLGQSLGAGLLQGGYARQLPVGRLVGLQRCLVVAVGPELC